MNSTNPATPTSGIIRDLLTRLPTRLPGYRQRPEQRRLIEEIDTALNRPRDPDAPNLGQNIVVANAPTGSGKSLGYLIGAVPTAQASGRKVVVATATVALQEQLLSVDLPFLVEHAGLNARFAMAKGRGRYVCNLKLAGLDGDERLMNLDPVDLDTLVKLAGLLADGWNGDRDHCPLPVNEALWRRVTNDRYGCAGTGCDHFDRCAYFRARQQLKEADVIVANHDVLLADLLLGGGYLLPKPEDTIYVIDEAHHLPSKAVAAMAADMRINSTHIQMERLNKLLPLIQQTLGRDARQLIDEARDAARRVVDGCNGLTSALANYGPVQDALQEGKPFSLPRWVFNHTLLPPAFEFPGRRMQESAKEALERLALLRNRLRVASEAQTVAKATADRLSSELGTHAHRLTRIIDTWNFMLAPRVRNEPPIARWVEAHEYETGIDYIIHGARISAAAALREQLFSRAAGVVLTSATLTVAGHFKHFMQQTGLGPLTETRYLILASPFDHERNAVLRIPLMLHDPGRPEAHTAEVAGRLPGLIVAGEGTLVLFCSRQQMEDVYHRLPEDLRPKVLRQGTASRDVLLRLHAERLARGETSVLFGLNEFSEGLNLPGKLCSHVIIAKIPFPVHDDPVKDAMARWIKDRGGNPFMEMAVPEAALRLVQATGRLLRHENDTGTVTILDRRIVSRPYGAPLLRSLPPFRHDIEARPRKKAA